MAKQSEVVRLADELALAIARKALGRPQELRVAEPGDTMGVAEPMPMDSMLGALDRLTRWVAVKNRIDDDEGTGFFDRPDAKKLSRAGGGRGGRARAQPADGDGGADRGNGTSHPGDGNPDPGT